MRRVGKFCRSKKAEFQAANNPLMEGKEKGSFKVVCVLLLLTIQQHGKKVKILDFARRSMVCRSTLGKVERMSEKWNGSAAPIITLPQTPRN